MSKMILSFFLVTAFVVVSAVEPTVNCPAPRSPVHGQAFLYQEGQTVKYTCEPGFSLQGKHIVRCIAGKWESPIPVCLTLTPQGNLLAKPEERIFDPQSTLSRPLFSWGDNELDHVQEPPLEPEPEPEPETYLEPEPEPEPEELLTNSTDDAMNDEARMQIRLYPRRRTIIRRIYPRVQSGTNLEEEQKKRTEDGSSTSTHLQAPPSVIYVRRDGRTDHLQPQFRRLSETSKREQLLSARREAVVAQNDKGQTSDDARRYMQWWAHQYYPRQASLSEYYHYGGYPLATTISESQLAWINSLHPEMRDQYLRDIYGTRGTDADATARAQAYYYRYGDPYYYYQTPSYYREPIAVVVEDPIAEYDYSCHQAHLSFVKAPKLPSAHVARYDRRQNPKAPQNHYLAAVYRCDPGHVMLDTRNTELYCSKRQWIGSQPVCVPVRG